MKILEVKNLTKIFGQKETPQPTLIQVYRDRRLFPLAKVALVLEILFSGFDFYQYCDILIKYQYKYFELIDFVSYCLLMYCESVSFDFIYGYNILGRYLNE